MKEIGQVRQTKDNTALVVFPENPGCAGCAMKCHARSGGREVEAINQVGASTGDTVEVIFEERAVLKGSFIVYLVPVIAMLIGYFLFVLLASAFAVSTADVFGVIGSLLFLVLSFVVLRYLFKSGAISEQQFIPVISRIIKQQ